MTAAATKLRKGATAVSYWEAKGLYYKVVGKKRSGVGKLVQAKWYLGSDRTVAETSAVKLVNLWGELRERFGLDAWGPYEAWAKVVISGEPVGPLPVTDDHEMSEQLELVKRYVNYVERIERHTGKLIIAGEDAKLHAALSAFAETVRNSDLKRSSINSTLGRIERLKRVHDNVAVDALDYDAINAMGSYWLRLPKAKTHESKGDKPISPTTAVTQVKTLRRFLRWLDATDTKPFTDWRMPRRFETCLMIDKRRLQRRYNDETGKNSRDEIRVFSDDELKRLWDYSTDRMRTYLLIALNTGATQGEIASMRLSEFYFNDDFAYCERDRHKTGVFGRFRLFDETARLVKAEIVKRRQQKAKGSDILFLNERGGLLVRDTTSGRYDRIGSLWDGPKGTLAKVKRHTTEIPKPRGFKFLRKTGAQFFRSHFNDEVAPLYLSHAMISANEQLDVYANKDFGKLDAAMPSWEAKVKLLLQF